MKITKQSIIESLVFIGIFTAILFPLRYILNNYLSHYWFGGIGIVTIVTLSLFYLSNKGKLGIIGIIIMKRIIRRSKGKLGIFFIILISIMIYVEGLIVTGITFADNDQVKEVTTILNEKGIHNINQAINVKAVNHDIVFYIESFIIMITPNQISFTLLKVINNLSGNFILPLVTVSFVESLEYLGIVLFFRYKMKENNSKIH